VRPARIAALSRSRLRAKARNSRTVEACTRFRQVSSPSPLWWHTPVQEGVRQPSCLREGAIYLRDLIQLGLGRLREAPLAGPASTQRLCLPSRLRKASEGLTQAKQAIPACGNARAIWPDADTHCGSIPCSLWPSTPPKEQCRCVRPHPSARADSASTNRADCVVVCEVRHRDHAPRPTSAESCVTQLPDAWQQFLLEDLPL